MLRKIRARIILPISVLLVASLVSFAGITWYQLRQDVYVSLKENARGLNGMLANSLRESMRRNDREHLTQMISDIGRLDWVLSVRVINKEGKITFASGESDVGMTISDASEICVTCHRVDPPSAEAVVRSERRDTDWVLRASRAIEVEAACTKCHELREGAVAGVLVVDLDMRPLLRDVSRRTFRNLWLLTLGSIGLLGILLLVVRSVVVRPLHDLSEALAALRRGNRLPTQSGGPADEIDDVKWALAALSADLEDRRFSTDIVRQLDRDLNGVGYGVMVVGADGDILLTNNKARAPVASKPDAIVGLSYATLDDARAEIWERSRIEPIVRHPREQRLGARGSDYVFISVVDDDTRPLLHIEASRAEEDEEGIVAAATDGFPKDFLRSPYRTADLREDSLFRAVVRASRLSRAGLDKSGVLALDATLAHALEAFSSLLSIKAEIEGQLGVCDMAAITRQLVDDFRRGRSADLHWHQLIAEKADVVGHPVLLRQLVVNLLDIATAAARGEVVVLVHHQTKEPKLFLGVWSDGAGSDGPDGLQWDLCQEITTRFNGSLEFDTRYDINTLARAFPGDLPELGSGELLIAELPVGSDLGE